MLKQLSEFARVLDFCGQILVYSQQKCEAFLILVVLLQHALVLPRDSLVFAGVIQSLFDDLIIDFP